MNGSIWNIYFLISLLYYCCFAVLLILITKLFKKLRLYISKFMLIVIPVVLVILYTNYSPYFFTDKQLIAIGHNEILSRYKSYDKITQVDGYGNTRLLEETNKVSFMEEKVVRKGNEFEYFATITVKTKYTGKDEYKRSLDYYMVYNWDKWRFVNRLIDF